MEQEPKRAEHTLFKLWTLADSEVHTEVTNTETTIKYLQGVVELSGANARVEVAVMVSKLKTMGYTVEGIHVIDSELILITVDGWQS